MSSPAKKASTGGIRKTTIKNNLYLKNRAALRERGFFILWITSSIKELPSPEAPTVSWIARVLCIQKLSWITDAKKQQGTSSFTQTGAATDTVPKHLSAADDPRKKRGCEEINPHFFTAPFYFAFIWFKVQGSGGGFAAFFLRWYSCIAAFPSRGRLIGSGFAAV